MTMSGQAPHHESLANGPAAESQGVGGSQLVPEPVRAPAPPKIGPTSAERFGAQLSFGRETYELLCHVQALLGHPAPTQDLAQVFHDALEAYARELEKRKYGATARPHSPQRRESHNPHYVPRHVKREVWKRDGARCTFVSDSGRRCEARSDLEFDHIEPVARGGESTVANLRLRCRAHNQLEAERLFGAGFMHEKRGRRLAETHDHARAS
jgi:5-methylcytosine-specific restriction endonuclease McrA